MGVRLPSVFTTTLLTVSLVTTAATNVATTPPLNISLPFQPVLLMAYYNLTTGTGTTSIKHLLVRGATILNFNQIDSLVPAAGLQLSKCICYIDANPGESAEIQYTLQLQQGGATGNATIQDVCLMAFAL
jgi:hypothetical protein